MSADIEWHDSSEEAPHGCPLWVYHGSGDWRSLEMGSFDRDGEWRSALNPEVTFDAERVNAWAVIEYPLMPLRLWVEPPAPDPEVGRNDG